MEGVTWTRHRELDKVSICAIQMWFTGKPAHGTQAHLKAGVSLRIQEWIHFSWVLWVCQIIKIITK